MFPTALAKPSKLKMAKNMPCHTLAQNEEKAADFYETSQCECWRPILQKNVIVFSSWRKLALKLSWHNFKSYPNST